MDDLYAVHSELLYKLSHPHKTEADSNSSCRTCTLITVRDHKTHSTHHTIIMARGHRLSVSNFENEIKQDYSWLISTIQTKQMCRFAVWYQGLLLEGDTCPKQFVLESPQDFVGQEYVDPKHILKCERGTGTEIYESGKVKIHIDKERIRFSINSDAVSGFFNLEEVSKMTVHYITIIIHLVIFLEAVKSDNYEV